MSVFRVSYYAQLFRHFNTVYNELLSTELCMMTAPMKITTKMKFMNILSIDRIAIRTLLYLKDFDL